MKQPLSMAALVCALPVYAVAQAPAPASVSASAPVSAPAAAAAAVPCQTKDRSAQRASAALPARVGTRPMPERGSIAPAGRVPSHVESASSRAMAAVAARDQAMDAKNNVAPECQAVSQDMAPAGSGKND